MTETLTNAERVALNDRDREEMSGLATARQVVKTAAVDMALAAGRLEAQVEFIDDRIQALADRINERMTA